MMSWQRLACLHQDQQEAELIEFLAVMLLVFLIQFAWEMSR